MALDSATPPETVTKENTMRSGSAVARSSMICGMRLLPYDIEVAPLDSFRNEVQSTLSWTLVSGAPIAKLEGDRAPDEATTLPPTVPGGEKTDKSLGKAEGVKGRGDSAILVGVGALLRYSLVLSGLARWS